MKFTKTWIRKRVKEARGKKKLKKWVLPWTPEEESFYQSMIQETIDDATKTKTNFENNIKAANWKYLVSPLYVHMERKTMEWKKISLNMNWYRNEHHMLSNNVKIAYKELMHDQIKDLKFDKPIHIHYKIFWSDRPDGMNVASIISKFLLDGMQLSKDKKTWELIWNDCISDDNIELVTESYGNWGRDKLNPRVEIYISVTE